VPLCPDCGGIMIKTGEDCIKKKRGRRIILIPRVLLDCIDCGSGIAILQKGREGK